MADVHFTKRRFPFLDTIQRFFLLMPQQPDELVFVAFAETFILLKSVEQLTIFVVELAASFTRKQTNSHKLKLKVKVNVNVDLYSASS